MNRRFNLKIQNVSFGEYGVFNKKELTLQVKTPYKNIFGKIKYTYLDVYSLYENDLPKTCKSVNDIMEYLISMFYKMRSETLVNRIINKKYIKELK